MVREPFLESIYSLNKDIGIDSDIVQLSNRLGTNAFAHKPSNHIGKQGIFRGIACKLVKDPEQDEQPAYH